MPARYQIKFQTDRRCNTGILFYYTADYQPHTNTAANQHPVKKLPEMVKSGTAGTKHEAKGRSPENSRPGCRDCWERAKNILHSGGYLYFSNRI
jgi:hypothetical protein